MMKQLYGPHGRQTGRTFEAAWARIRHVLDCTSDELRELRAATEATEPTQRYRLGWALDLVDDMACRGFTVRQCVENIAALGRGDDPPHQMREGSRLLDDEKLCIRNLNLPEWHAGPNLTRKLRHEQAVRR